MALRPEARPRPRDAVGGRAPRSEHRSIVLHVEFKDASHFSRAFKSRFGTSPATYRRTAVRAPSGNV
ncbi:AraC family transcriptional regulator [Streptomyces sp. NPDC057424]|uniref:AraC family transcriptional regulator n=1 Tax=Streptomyces sp. NPDC057424 TaxID=3346127 RepID=UPI0036C40DD3